MELQRGRNGGRQIGRDVAVPRFCAQLPALLRRAYSLNPETRIPLRLVTGKAMSSSDRPAGALPPRATPLRAHDPRRIGPYELLGSSAKAAWGSYTSVVVRTSGSSRSRWCGPSTPGTRSSGPGSGARRTAPCLYYGYMRPGEAKLLRERDCIDLPDTAWGHLRLTSSAPRVGAEWTDSGTSHEERHLKHRAKKVTRPVPIPPELVRLLRRHLTKYGREGTRRPAVSRRAWRPTVGKRVRAGMAENPPRGAHRCAGRLSARRTPVHLRHSGVNPWG